MTKVANEPVKIHLTLDKSDFEKLEAIARLKTLPGNKTPKPQAIVRMIINEYPTTQD
jgi:hypothetical protein